MGKYDPFNEATLHHSWIEAQKLLVKEKHPAAAPYVAWLVTHGDYFYTAEDGDSFRQAVRERMRRE